MKFDVINVDPYVQGYYVHNDIYYCSIYWNLGNLCFIFNNLNTGLRHEFIEYSCELLTKEIVDKMFNKTLLDDEFNELCDKMEEYLLFK